MLDRRMSVVGLRPSDETRRVGSRFFRFRVISAIVIVRVAHTHTGHCPVRRAGPMGMAGPAVRRLASRWPLRSCAAAARPGRCGPGASRLSRRAHGRALPAKMRTRKIITPREHRIAHSRAAFSALRYILCNNGMWSIRENPQAQPMCHTLTLLRHVVRRTPNEVKHRSAPKPTQRSPATGQF